jgi:hypothetical protein
MNQCTPEHLFYLAKTRESFRLATCKTTWPVSIPHTHTHTQQQPRRLAMPAIRDPWPYTLKQVDSSCACGTSVSDVRASLITLDKHASYIASLHLYLPTIVPLYASRGGCAGHQAAGFFSVSLVPVARSQHLRLRPHRSHRSHPQCAQDSETSKRQASSQ